MAINCRQEQECEPVSVFGVSVQQAYKWLAHSILALSLVANDLLSITLVSVQFATVRNPSIPYYPDLLRNFVFDCVGALVYWYFCNETRNVEI